jgi:HK97 family phage portal protein
MGLLDAVLDGRPIGATYSPWDNFWYTADPRDARTVSGYPVSGDNSMRLPAVAGCVDLISNMVGVIPLHIMRALDNDGREKAKSNPVYRLLRHRPNPRQTAKEWLTMGVARLLLGGNFYNQIMFDGRGAITALEPLYSHFMQVRLLDSGRRGYLYRAPGKPPRSFTQDEILHVMNLTLDGVTGISVIENARASIEAGLAQGDYAGQFWHEGGEPRSLLTFKGPGKLLPEQMDNLQRTWRERARNLAILQGGLEYTPISTTNRDGQFIEARKFSVEEICMYFRVPPDMIGHNDGTSQWGTGIEQRGRGFIDYTLMPWLVSIEQAVNRDLLDDDTGTLFAKFNADALLRGQSSERATEHRQYVDGGIKSVNEVRRLEDLNPLEGEEYDKPHRAGNMGGDPGGGDPETTKKPEAPPRLRLVDDDDDDEEEETAARIARANRITMAAAERLVRKEVASIRKMAARYAGEADEWRKRVTTFYGEHAGELETALALETATARRYCADHCARVCENGGEMGEDYERTQPAVLAALATEGHRG